MNQGLSLPPLLVGEPASGADPMARARALAAQGCDGGTLVHDIQPDRLRASLIVAPEVPLADAMAMLPICAVGFQNALGALAPPEVAVHLTWAGDILVNGACCGAFRVAGSTQDPNAVPDWLIVGLDLTIQLEADNPGLSPDKTSLYEEGCADIDPVLLCEAWARHTLVWINRWTEEGNAPVHADWVPLLDGVGKPVTQDGYQGEFLGVDEKFGMLIRDDETTQLLPLTTLLETDP
ncbi:DUF4444 domain-containing protein [Sulfitobacter sp. BDSS02]|nr:DUF4444 domain-containing protein [Sulfitobacter sp. BDSS02]MBR9849223.1 DUF4444 domain-containing protein [Paracoccaceae bacterium]